MNQFDSLQRVGVPEENELCIGESCQIFSDESSLALALALDRRDLED